MKVVPALLLLLPLVVVAQSPLPDKPHVYVQGNAEIPVQADTLKLSGTVSVVAMEASIAEEEVQQRSARLLMVAREHGIESEQIKASAIAVSPSYDYVNGGREFLGYTVTRDVEITVSVLDDYYTLLRAVVDSGALDFLDAVFSYSDIDRVVREAQLAAVEDARLRAQSLAERANASLGKVYSISEFDLRQEEQYLLTPSREFYESTLGSSDAVVVTGTRIRNVAISGVQLFQAASVSAFAEVYVVYLLKP
jgi:uncharacterized protein YggE